MKQLRKQNVHKSTLKTYTLRQSLHPARPSTHRVCDLAARKLYPDASAF